MKYSLFAILVLVLSSCATNPATKGSDFVLMSEEQELKLGQQAAAEVAKSMTLLPDTDPLAKYVDSVGQKMAAVSDRPELFYRFHVVDDATINAFALPGGYIYIYRGLLTHLNSEAELAAVLGHEIGHVTARHAVKRYTQAQAYQLGMMVTSIFVPVPQAAGQLSDLLALAVIQGYGREAESQADELALKYLARAQYDPHAVIGILKTLKRLDDIDSLEKKDAGEKVEKYHGAFASHPETEQRIRDAVQLAAERQAGTGLVNRNALLLAVDGYPYGDSPEQGAVVGQRFLHPELGIQLEFPEDWVITNNPGALNARIRQQKVFFQMQLKELRKRRSASEVLASLFPKRHTSAITAGEQAGMPYAHATVEISAPHVSQATVDARVFLKGSKAFILLMWCERDKFAVRQPAFTKIAESFRDYNLKRDGDVPRIFLHTWKAADSWQSLAGNSHMILGRFTAEKFAALNGMDKTEHPPVEEIIKLVH
ncbi:MAG TPA: M48 family metalloprotease [Mariprofundaceae bacterium]|nr:M48 family metalloprotease [Mariprofundaceae bacterium]